MQTIKRFLLSSVLVGLAFGPLVSSARSLEASNDATTSTGTPVTTSKTPEANFCTRITNTSSDLNGVLKKLSDDRGRIRTEMLQSLSDRKTKRAQEVQTNRDEFNTKLTEHINDLGSKATTDAQKAAIATFKAAVLAAQATRKTAVDAAIATYMSGAQGTITDRENKVKAAATTFQTAVDVAIAQAKTDCANKVNPATARQTMYDAVKTANQAFRAVVTALPDGTLVNLAKTRDAAIQAANQVFRAAVQTAAQALKAALGTAATTTPTP